MKENVLIDKSIAFAARIVKLHDFLIKNKRGLTIAKQVIRSGTSIGANVAEAEQAAEKAGIEREPVCAGCGAALAEGVKFCGECGKPVE